MTNEERIARITHAIDLAFEERDPYFQQYFFANLFHLKWLRAALLQGSDV